MDTCALIWAVNRDPMFPTALKSIRTAAKAGELFLSPVSACEIGVLGLKLVTRDSRILAYGAQGHISVLPC